MAIKVCKPSQDEITRMRNWPTWAKEISVFDWHYDTEETCYLLTGTVQVTSEDGTVTTFGAGDCVTFPAGLSCTWDIRSPVLKHFRLD